ncbi:hypothetical protein KIN20_003561 [Parelaphostrongylus tenuis]|uniref:Spermatogenesis-associated protein 20-like TRX domain-containing protein n=1 Tax=Parelaphostrongylus tenuis TaxID=148309 RepID=A0AAD5QG50_PARTN|nr:hypothetical protein KIN20_003561 [Parelaphostrongylus tenuis]
MHALKSHGVRLILSNLQRLCRKGAIACLQISNMSTEKRFTNKLAHEKSPYLLQHRHNPIEWYPWGSEAFSKAKELNRPIFLSVGYSTCHWCHVMEKESFENEEIAQILNSDFISVKVDREERPDVDRLYMSFIQRTTGSGGWPMTVFLTPDLDPITGGTYFPPCDSHGGLGLPSILKLVIDNWKDESTRATISSQGRMITEALKKDSVHSAGQAPPFETVAKTVVQYKASAFDREHGGFGRAPKFPKACDLEFLINHFCWTKDNSEKELCRHMLNVTLEAMSLGGIHDHIGKGFHRYSVDAEWHVPHFEKMLYDQAQLLGVYSDYCRLFGGEFSDVVEDIAQYMEECLSHKDGGFYSAEDADSLPTESSLEKREGAFCVWKMSEVQELLKGLRIGEKDAIDIVCQYYDIREGGNVSRSKDPHGELEEQNVLRMLRSHEDYARHFEIDSEVLNAGILKTKSILAEARSRRPPPHLDSKMVTAWQGLALTGLAKAAMASSSFDFVGRAIKTVDFIKRFLMEEGGQLLRCAYRGHDGNVEIPDDPISAFSDDYAMLIQGLLDLYQVVGDLELLKLADTLQHKMDEDFWDVEKESGYYIGSGHGDVKVRVMEDQDGAEPCTNSVAVGNLIRLYEYFDTTEYKRKAEKIIEACSSRLSRGMKLPNCSDAKIQSHYICNILILFLDTSIDNSFITERCSVYKDMLSVERPTGFICADFTCGPPINTLDALKVELKRLGTSRNEDL